uniref:Uncharacterized protein n=1 Tax=Amphimedon queenslandica TaxID=400682 RepID=A0A1X7T067_AMPQE
MYYQQLQEKEREEAKMKQYYNHELQKIRKELEDRVNEIQRLNQLLQNKSEELIERDQKVKEHLQQIQQYEHLKDTNIQQETRVDQDKVQEVKLLHSSEEVEQNSVIPSEDRKLQEDTKKASKDDSKLGNQMHELTQVGCNSDILDDKVVKSVTVDELKGVHIAEKNSFLIHGGSIQSVKWEEYGIRITIPQGAVLPSDTVQVTIAALVGGDFIFPEDTELASAVYAINITKPFLKPVKLEIQHCVSIETVSHCSYLSFATSTNNQPPYQFDTVDGGEFFIGNRYGSISVATFSKYAALKKKSKKCKKASRKESKKEMSKDHIGDIQPASAGTIASNTGPISPDDEESKSGGEVLRENFDTLSDILAAPNNLSAIIMSLYAKKLISDTTTTECMNDGRQVQDRCASLLFALKATIDGKPQAMNTLIEALKNNEAFKEIAHKMDLEVSYRNYTNP